MSRLKDMSTEELQEQMMVYSGLARAASTRGTDGESVAFFANTMVEKLREEQAFRNGYKTKMAHNRDFRFPALNGISRQALIELGMAQNPRDFSKYLPKEDSGITKEEVDEGLLVSEMMALENATSAGERGIIGRRIMSKYGDVIRKVLGK